ncbi:Hypothetical predicted protein [Cloeon dipterum]|uniref:Uncharacterized protein n=1 Tax=Cloeon dipterum TaxID=197152 RepID=A0A8S1CRB4_9INSE|nr:Hypothetical predicted protein [Cloeon dipterum]
MRAFCLHRSLLNNAAISSGLLFFDCSPLLTSSYLLTNDAIFTPAATSSMMCIELGMVFAPKVFEWRDVTVLAKQQITVAVAKDLTRFSRFGGDAEAVALIGVAVGAAGQGRARQAAGKERRHAEQVEKVQELRQPRRRGGTVRTKRNSMTVRQRLYFNNLKGSSGGPWK